MARLGVMLLLSLSVIGCSRLEVNRLERGTDNIDLRSYSDLVIVTQGNKLSGQEYDIARKQLDEVKFFTISRDSNYVDSADKTPLALVIGVNQRTDETIKQETEEEDGVKQIKYIRTGRVYVDFTIMLKEYRKFKQDPTYTDHLAIQETHLDDRQHTESYAPNPPPLDYGQVREGTFDKYFMKFNTAVFPHYHRYRYSKSTERKMPEIKDGIDAFVAKDYKRAAVCFQNAVKTGTNNPEVDKDDLAKAYFYLGLSTEMQGDFDHAIQHYDKALQLDSGFKACGQARQCAIKCKEDWLFLTGSTAENK